MTSWYGGCFSLKDGCNGLQCVCDHINPLTIHLEMGCRYTPDQVLLIRLPDGRAANVSINTCPWIILHYCEGSQGMPHPFLDKVLHQCVALGLTADPGS